MRIVIVTAFPENPETPRGGVEAVSVTLVRALHEHADLDVHVVTVRPQLRAPETRRWHGVPVHALPRLGLTTLTSAIGADRRQVHACLDALRPDVVHAHDTAGLMVRGFPAPRVLTIHGFIHADTRVSGQRFARSRAVLWRVLETAAWADYPHIIAISPYVRERLSGVGRAAIHDIDNPIDARYFATPRTPASVPTIFSAAVISRRKNPLALVEAVIRLNARGIPVRLRLAGAVAEQQYHARVRELIARRAPAGTIELLGPLPTARVEEELAGAALFALVSREENSPLGIEEAMAAGLPVVTSNRCGMPYMVRDGETGWLVDPENPEEIAERIGLLISDPALRQAMGERGKAVAAERFHPAVVAARTRAVYLRAAGRS